MKATCLSKFRPIFGAQLLSVFAYVFLLLIFLPGSCSAQTDTALNGPGNVFETANVLGTGGSGPTTAAVADFNGDGHADVVVGNGGNGKIGVLLGNGDGTFQAPKVTSTTCNPDWIVTGDFNGDGKPDIAVLGRTCSPQLLILLGNGDGTFTLKSSVSLAGAQTVVAGDFNGDGKLDLAVVVDGSPDAANVLLGKGDGTFNAPISTSLGASVQAFQAIVADFNKDGHADLAISEINGSGFLVILGKGDGTFQAATSFALPAQGYGLAAADFNNDGIPDVVATTPAGGGVSVFLGDGTGKFKAVNNPVSGTLPTANTGIPGFGSRSVVAADFNNDGKTDVMVGIPGATVSVLLGKGDGTLEGQLLFATAPQNVAAIAVGDFNGDGKLDWVAVNNQPVDAVTIALGRGDGTFKAERVYVADNTPAWFAFADFNSDGVLDMLVPNQPANTIDILLGNKDGTFQTPTGFAFSGSPGMVVTGDFNKDGKQDFVVRDTFGSPQTVAVYLGNGNGTFQAPKSFSTGGVNGSWVVAGDFNGDGKLDLAVSNNDGGSPNFAILLGNGDGTFGAPIMTATGGGSTQWIATGDFNKDGHLDLLVVDNTNGDVAIFLGKGDGTFQAPTLLPRKFANTAAVGDFNNDGNLDFVVISGDGFAYVYLGKGDGTFNLPMTVTLGSPLAPSGPTWVAVGDFNVDGNLDFVVGEPPLRGQNNGYQGIQLLLGNGDGTFQPVQDYLAGPGNILLPTSVADFNGDGGPDVAVLNFFGNPNSIMVLLNLTRVLKVTLAGGGLGSVTSSPAGINCPSKCVRGFSDGTVVNLSANAAAGSIFTGWSGGCSGTGACSVTMDAAKSVTATFKLVFPLTVTLAGSGTGTVTSSPAGINCPGTCTANFISGAVVMLTEIRAAGSVFSGWSQACSGTGACSVTMNAASAVTATFTAVFPLTVSLAGTGKGTVASSPAAINCPTTCNATFGSGTMVTLTPTAASGSVFAGWSGACTGTGSCSVTMSSSKSVTATFSVSIIAFSPTSLSFGTVAIGTTTTGMKVTLKNTGTATLTITGIAITGTNAGDFSQTHTCGSSLAVGASCTFSVTFKPTASGTRSASLTVTDNAAGSPQKVPLSGIGTAAKLSPTNLSFGTVAIGVTSGAGKVTLTNLATTSLTITGIAITGTNAADFSQTHTCGSSLAVGASCTFSVTFKPTASGTRSASLTVTDNAAGSPQKVPLSGIGTAAKLSPSGVNFGSVKVGMTSAAISVTLTNVGTTTLMITGIAITGTNAGDFSQTHTCGSSLAAGSSCTISVKFKPSATGSRSAALSVSDNAVGSPQKATLAGTGS